MAFLGGALLLLILLVVPGALVARLAGDDEAALLLGAGWGLGVVPSIAFWLHLVTGAELGAWMVVLVAALHVAAAVALRARVDDWLAPFRAHGRLLLAATAVAVLFLLWFDTSPLPPASSCIYTAALAAIGEREEGIRLLFDNIEDARLGNTGVIASFLLLAGEAGFRWLYAACGFLLALGGAALGRSVAGDRGAVVGLLALPLNPYVLAVPQADENLLALSWAAVALPLLLQRRLLFGGAMLFGLVLSMRHSLVLSVPALFLLPKTWRDRGLLAAGLAAGTAMEHLHHLLALGSLLRFESNAQFPPLPYRFLGIPLSWEGMVNWPLHDRLVRTPWNPFPTMVGWPLLLAERLGTVAFVAVVAGAVGTLRTATGRFWMAWAVPTIGVLALQESWDFPNKWGVLLTVFPAVLWWGLSGARWLGTRTGLAGWAAALGLVVAAPSLADWRVDADERYAAWFTESADESDPWVEAEAQARTRLRPWPDYRGLGRTGPSFSMGKLGALADVAADPELREGQPPWGWFPHDLPPGGPPVTIEIDLEALRPGQPLPVRVVDVDADLSVGAGPVRRASDLRVSWDERPLSAYALGGTRVAAVAFAFDRRASDPCACEWTGEEFAAPCDGRCALLFDVGGAHVDEAPRRSGGPPAVPVGRSTLRIRVPAGGLSVALFQLPLANRFELWTLTVGPDGVVQQGPYRPWHS